MTREARERAAMAQAGLTAIKLADDAACWGHIRINRQPLGLCMNCARYGNGKPPTLDPAAAIGANGWDCPNRRSLGAMLDAETVAAVDDQAGLHGANCAPANQAAPLCELGGCESIHASSGGVSHE